MLWCQDVQKIELSNRKLWIRTKVQRMITMHAHPRWMDGRTSWR